MKSRRRCGCDCFNSTTYAPCVDENGNSLLELPCCEHCGPAPCAYAILWECPFDTIDGTYIGIKHPAIEYLWKECLFDCIWTSRTCLQIDAVIDPDDPLAICIGADCFTLDSSYSPCNTSVLNADGSRDILTSAIPPVCEHIEPTEMQGQGDLSWCQLEFDCCQKLPYPQDYLCGWRDYYGSLTGARPQILDTCMPVISKLTVTGAGTATLTIEGGSGPLATYMCDDFHCLDRSTFILQSPLPPVEGIQSQVCVVPAVSQFRTPCATAQDACDCKDPGWSGGTVTLHSSCPGLDGYVVEFTRNAALPCGLSDPGGPCGYFISDGIPRCTSGDPKTLYFLVYCDGSQWVVKAYCKNNGTGVCDEVCDTTSTFGEYCPDGATLDFECDSFGECCACCQDCYPLGTTLNVDVTGPGSGSGTFIASSGVDCVAITLSNGDRMSVGWTGTLCTIKIGCNAIDCVSFNQTLFSSSYVLNSCDPYDVTITVVVSAVGAHPCAGGTWTIHIYE